MPKRDWEHFLPYLGLGGIVLAAGRGAADPDDPDDGDGDNGNGGSDPDPDPNDPPTVEIDSLSLSGDTITAEAVANDPDGSISAIDWKLTHSQEGTVGMDSGPECSILLTAEGDHSLTVTATDDAGATDSDAYGFTYAPSDPDPNEDPSVSITSLSVDSGQVSASADGNDPDGQIVSYTWELDLVGQTVDTASGKSATLDLASSGDYVTRVKVEDDQGATAEDTYSFPYEAPDPDPDPVEYDHKLTFSKRDDPFVTYQDVYIVFESTGELEASGDIDSGAWSQQGGTAEPSLSGTESVTVRYNGDISYLDWQGGPFTLYRDDQRVDPWELGSGPRYTWTDGTSDVIEATVRQSAAQYARQGPASAETAAMWLSETLKEHDISHDILYSLPVIELPSENPGCKNPLRGDDPCWGDDSCSDWDCCATEDFMPAAYYWWRSHLNEGGWSDRFREQSGTDYDSRGDGWVMRKDSNIMLVDAGGGGCGSVGGHQCVAGADAIGDMAYDPSTSTSTAINQIHNVMHEFGHNMGYGHPSYDDECPAGGGEAWIDGHGRWNRHPCVPGNGCTNRCGFEIEDRSGTTSNVVVFHPTFTDCTADQFKSNMSPPEGRVRETTALGTETEGICTDPDVCGPSETCDGSCDGTCGCEGC